MKDSANLLNNTNYFGKVWNELPQALASMSMHAKPNICTLIKQATFLH